MSWSFLWGRPWAGPGLSLVAAGLFETTLVVVDATAGVGSVAEMAVGATIRLLAFTGLVYLAA